MRLPENYPEFLADLARALQGLLVADGIPADRADTLALAAAEHVRRQWKGAFVYIPSGDKFDQSERNKQILARFDGGNVKALATEFGMTEPSVYRLLRKLRKREDAE